MALTASQIFDAIAPSLNVTGEQKATYIELAESEIAESYRNGAYGAQLIANLAAHKATMAQRNGVSSPIEGIKEGDLMIQYRTTNSSTNFKAFDSTSYGLEYKRLLRLATAVTAGVIA